MKTAASFSPALFEFLRDLTRHNNREWFAAHRDRYVADVEAPMLRFIAAVGERLSEVSPAFVADPRRSGGSMYRIYRDTRFSADKSPYKTWVAARFEHKSASKDRVTPGFYLHLSASERFAGGGIYHPDTATLTRIRERVVADPKAWARVRAAGIELEGEQLRRAPAGFDPAHKFIEDLKRKDWYAGTEFTEKQVVSPGFLEAFLTACQDVAPLVEFLAKAGGLRW